MLSLCQSLHWHDSWQLAAAAGRRSARQRHREQLQEALEQQTAVQLSDVQEETVGNLQKRLAGALVTANADRRVGGLANCCSIGSAACCPAWAGGCCWWMDKKLACAPLDSLHHVYCDLLV